MRSDLDQEFLEICVQVLEKEDASLLAQLRQLLAQGATSSCFEDYELCRFNFHTLLSSYLCDDHLTRGISDEQLTTAMRLVCKAGDEFKTNRGYVGNGGLPTLFFLFYFLASGKDYCCFRKAIDSQRVVDKAKFCFELLHEFLDDHRFDEFFWADYFPIILSGYVEEDNALKDIQNNVLILCLHNNVLLKLGSLLRSDRRPSYHLYKNIKGPAVIEFVELLLREEKIEEFVQLVTDVEEDIIKNIFNRFFSSSEMIALFHGLLERYSWFRRLLFDRPALIFSLVRMKQRKTIDLLVRLNSSKMRKIRDKNGNNLLQYLSEVRGKTDRIESILSRLKYDQ